ncbi:MAG: 2-amino-4-hydroxy-6-hydroxymethyldihydropteridine diphosphokinase [Candidatus Omnitrophica bacterium]|nr:2-amino-4-hydroxy-6-hydroxymethyldihydropteridine diphosphokinase [Candidatus Omnitrophota bacterium]
MEEAFLGVGSNLGKRKENIERALELLGSNPQIVIEKISSFIETLPQGGPPQGKFINAVVKIRTSLAPYELLLFLQEIEKRLGRKREERWGPRPIDLDILIYGRKKIAYPYLQIPHPRLQEREFVLGPLSEIEPAWKEKFDVLGRTSE